MKQMEWSELRTHSAFTKAKGKILRLPIRNPRSTPLAAFHILCYHFICQQDKEVILTNYPQWKSSFAKLTSIHEGKESSRNPNVRFIFRQMCIELGLGDPFEEYTGEQGSRGGPKPRKPPTARPFLPSLDRAVSRKASEGN